MKYFFKVIFTPGCWVQNKSYSAILDAKLNKLMQEGDFYNIDKYHAEIGGIKLWISNHPYASFSMGMERPSRRTILKAHDKLLNDFISKEIIDSTCVKQ
jgi:hypothetical protein